MEEIFFLGLLLFYIFLSSIAAIIAHKRGRSIAGLLIFLFLTPLAGLFLAAVISGITGMPAFASIPLVVLPIAFAGIAWALVAKGRDEMVSAYGRYDGMCKCPFCAETVRIEAIKCKHCGSALKSNPPPVPPQM